MRLYSRPGSEKQKNVIGVFAGSEYGALRAVTNDLGVRLSAFGYVPELVDISTSEGLKTLGKCLSKGETAFAFGYAGVGSQVNMGSNNLWTSLRIPFVSLWFDHPAYNYRQHIVPSPYILHVYHVRDYFEARLKYLPQTGKAILLPPAGGGALYGTDSIPWKDRETVILYAKTGTNPKAIESKWRTYPKKLEDILQALADQGRKNSSLDLANATAAQFLRENLPCNDLDNFFGVMQEVDRYIRVWRSDLLARALLPHEAKIFGDGWDYLSDQPKRARIFPSFASSEFLNMVNRHRIVANASPLWRDAIHERVQMAIGCGNIALTDRTVKSDAVFSSLENYIGFDWPDNLSDAISTAVEKAKSSKGDYFIESDKVLKSLPAFSEEEFLIPLEQALIGIIYL